jgi:hypothetical protein
MRSFLKYSLLVITLCAVTSLTVSAAKVKKVTVTFPEKVTVNGTVLKAGTYQLHFDEQAGELTIKKNGDVVATTKARLEKRDAKAKRTAVITQGQGDSNELVSITVGGETENLVIGED